MAKLCGVSLRQLAGWLGRSERVVSKAPDSDYFQEDLSYFERVARLRLLMKGDGEFRQWLRMSHPEVLGKNPLELLARRKWQALVDLVEDILSQTSGFESKPHLAGTIQLKSRCTIWSDCVCANKQVCRASTGGEPNGAATN